MPGPSEGLSPSPLWPLHSPRRDRHLPAGPALTALPAQRHFNRPALRRPRPPAAHMVESLPRGTLGKVVPGHSRWVLRRRGGTSRGAPWASPPGAAGEALCGGGAIGEPEAGAACNRVAQCLMFQWVCQPGAAVHKHFCCALKSSSTRRAGGALTLADWESQLRFSRGCGLDQGTINIHRL